MHIVFLINFGHSPQVFLVVAVAAVLVLHLDGDDIAAVFPEIGAQLPEELFVIPGNLGKEFLVIAAQVHLLIGQEPGGKPPEFQLRADVWAGAENNVKSQILGGADKTGDIQPAFKIELALFALMQVPTGVSFYAVKAGGTQFL